MSLASIVNRADSNFSCWQDDQIWLFYSQMATFVTLIGGFENSLAIFNILNLVTLPVRVDIRLFWI